MASGDRTQVLLLGRQAFHQVSLHLSEPTGEVRVTEAHLPVEALGEGEPGERA